MQSRHRFAVALVFMALLVQAGCLRAAGDRREPAGRPLTVAAAANLQQAFTEIAAGFEASTGEKVVLTFGASGQLARQIENGAPVDVFASADVGYVDALLARGLMIPDTRVLYARGRIVLVANRAAAVEVRDLAALADPRIRKVAIANPAHAPYGAAAREALTRAGIWEKVEPKLVFGENIRQTLQFVQTGNAEAGIVSRSEAGVPEVVASPIDDRLYSPLNQAAAVVKGTPREGAARRFLQFVVGPEGQAVLEKYGYARPEEGAR
ncbi:molybdate ABC transporter substrate-binding protein [Caldinitratiruptor microaerophilus]|uniref:Molybdate ABC transporter substrate-binding protein n=1 Tax=Caldinitratiruptor microaerophilus TaxID=671077 RepID=A0AA35G5S5_9FIRM|nr:molybdate ABC transporter substrate-binding protein [Caldinitratiruptor microaerophilus]BDG60031.1 molybdate ABC transporter substrate-binding protein [Caldinitratiruptor microaerophilus]